VFAIVVDLDGAVLNRARRTVGFYQPAYSDASLLKADPLTRGNRLWSSSDRRRRSGLRLGEGR
jgi:hypothetical protein